MAFLTWTSPRMSSADSPMTGNREYPLRRAASRMSDTGWSASMVSTRMRGVITSAAVRPEKFRVRAMKFAVPGSSVPMAADLRTREASSAGVRAPEISSLASSPKTLSTLFEKPFRSTMAGLKMAVKISCGRASTRPMRNDERDRHVFRDQFAQQHGQTRRDHHRHHQGDGTGHGLGDADGGKRRLEQRAHGRLHDVAGQQRGHGDAELAAGQLRRQGFQALEQRHCRGVAVVNGTLHSGLVQRNKGKFDGDEETGSENEQQSGGNKEPFH